MDKKVRNMIKHMVQEARKLLEIEIGELLEGVYGLHKDGELEDLSGLPKIRDDDNAIRAREGFIYFIKNEYSLGLNKKEGFKKLIFELAFTHLNRLVALKLMEKRKIIKETISRSYSSNGFKFYLADHPEDEKLWSNGNVYEAYKNFLLFQYAQISKEIKILFNPKDLSSYVFPQERALNSLLMLLNQDELSNIWEEDETIGWIYQYFTPKEFREKMREGSSVPRNSYELAARNQFYTPRYVVQLLVDNTLGRLWYEICKGNTLLRSNCEYLIRRPNEVFLNKGENPLGRQKKEGDISQSKFLNKSLYIPYRQKKDPREILILDPSCGSGHFLIYCFDLLWLIYMEAYEDEELGKSLRQKFPEKEDYNEAVPSLILEHNLYGIDIDLRSTQITSLALFLKAKKLHKNSIIRRTNIICAERMPGEHQIFEEFVRELKPIVLKELVKEIWNKMELADEAGSLLKIEQEIKESVQLAKKAWLARPREEQLNLFGAEKPRQQEFDFSDLSDESFWEEAEARISETLKIYTDKSNSKLSKRLFSEEAKKGLSFLDLCNQKYDVVIMNPPFGETTERSRVYIHNRYPRWNKNLLCAFFERALEMTDKMGFVGAIFDRTAIIKKTYQNFRIDVLLDSRSIYALVDTGWEVLDANVETSTLVLSKLYRSIERNKEGIFIKVLDVDKKEKSGQIKQGIKNLNYGKIDERVYLSNPEDFRKLPNSVLIYDVPKFAARAFRLGKHFNLATVGLQAKADEFMRFFWEVKRYDIEGNKRYALFYNGGDYSPYFLPTKDVIYWEYNGRRIKSHPSSRQENKTYFQEGLCYGKRGEFVDVHILRKNHIYSVEGLGIPLGPFQLRYRWYLLGLLNSAFIQYLVNLYCGQHKHVGYINLLPIIIMEDKNINNLARRGYFLKSDWYKGDETNYTFEKPWILEIFNKTKHNDIKEVISELINKEKNANCELVSISKNIDSIVFNIYGIIDSKDIAIVKNAVEKRAKDVLWKETRDWDDKRKSQEHVQSLLSYYLGCIFGYWDIINGGRLNPTHLRNRKIKNLNTIISKKEYQLIEKDKIIAVPIKEILTREEVSNAPEINYPINIDFDGILVDDEGHPDDIVCRISDCISATFGVANELSFRGEIEQIFDVSNLRDYFKNRFFKWHCKRYSDRPIYWQLSVKSKSYSVWLYYHKITRDTIFIIIKDYLIPKINLENAKLNDLKSDLAGMNTGREKRSREKDICTIEDFILELREFHESLNNIADKGYDPNFDDGIILNMAPLHELIPWNEPDKYWKDLQEGKYDWAHIAMRYWPERAKEKCKSDKSLAIAHGLEVLYED